MQLLTINDSFRIDSSPLKGMNKILKPILYNRTKNSAQKIGFFLMH